MNSARDIKSAEELLTAMAGVPHTHTTARLLAVIADLVVTCKLLQLEVEERGYHLQEMADQHSNGY